MNRTSKIGLPVVLAVVTMTAVAIVAVMAQGGATKTANAQTTNPSKSEIVVSGIGRVYVAPDTAVASIGVDITAPTLDEATKQANDAMTAVIAAIKAQGVDAKDIQTSGYSVYPITNSPKEGETAKITGYRVTNVVTVKVRNIANVGKVLDAALAAGANSVNSVYFTVEDATKAENDARTAAVKDAMAKAQTLASAAGVTVGKVTLISDLQPVVIPFYRSDAFESAPAAGGAGPVQTGTNEISATVEMHFEIGQ